MQEGSTTGGVAVAISCFHKVYHNSIDKKSGEALGRDRAHFGRRPMAPLLVGGTGRVKPAPSPLRSQGVR